MNSAAVSVAKRPDRRAAWRSTADAPSSIRVERWDARRDGPLTEAGLRQSLLARGYETAARTYASGPIASVHTDGRPRVQAILSGEVRVTFDGQSALLSAGDAIYISGGGIRCIEVVGSPAARSLEGACRADAG